MWGHEASPAICSQGSLPALASLAATTFRRCLCRRGTHPHSLFPLQVSASSDPRAAGDEELPPSGKARGLRRSGQAGPRRHRRRGAAQQVARSPAVPQPSSAGREESLPFVLDLQSLPGLANVDLSAQNPNIQVGSGAGRDGLGSTA